MKRIIGVISDTHGLLRPETLQALQGADLIVHAGDIGSQHVLDALSSIARVVAVRGNMDHDAWAYALPRSESFDIDGISVYVIHDLNRMDLVPESAYIRVAISGHSHNPSIAKRNGVLYLNPGSAGPRRFSLPVSVARILINGDDMSAKIITLKV